MTGKGKMTNLIGNKVKTLLTKQKKPPIIIEWKQNHKDTIQEETKIIIKSDSPPNWKAKGTKRVTLDKDSKRYVLKMNRLSNKHKIRPTMCSL
jgi:putative cell wall-binding protein